MKKRLLLTLLPLAFLVAACSGNSQEAADEASRQAAQSQSQAAAQSQAAGDATSADAADDTSAAANTDARAYDTLKSEGYEVLIGSSYYELESQTADTGRKESYNIKNIEFEEGQKVSVYLDGTQLSVWAEADKANGVYPNYNERPQESQYDEFTITAGEEGDIYFHVNSDDSYSIWITPAQSEGGSGSGEGSGSGSAPEGAPATGMAVCVNGTDFYALTNEGAWSYDSSFTQYSNTTGIALEAGDVITFYNADAEGGPATWGTMNIDPASQGSLTQESDGLHVGVAGTYDIYIKMKFAQDNIYMGPHAA